MFLEVNMLYDIVPLPLRFRKGAELSSLVPYIDNGSCDDMHSLGWEISIDAIMSSGFSKYKTLDVIGNIVLERVFFTEKPIDLSKSWWSSTDTVYPLYQTGYGGPTSDTTVRYLAGSMAVLATQDDVPTAINSIHTCVLCALKKSVYWTDDITQMLKNPSLPIHQLVIGNERNNLNLLSDAKDLPQCPEYYMSKAVCGEWVPKVQIDPLTQTFLSKTMCLNDLNKFKSKCFGIPMCSVLTVDIEQPFDPKEEDVLYGELDVDKRDGFLMLLSDIENVDATDYYIEMTFNNKKVVKTQGEFFNRYKGISSRFATVDGMTEMIIGVQRWQWKSLNGETNSLKEVKIAKYWTDEVYITLVWEDGSSTKYYIDLVLYNSISRCVLDSRLLKE